MKEKMEGIIFVLNVIRTTAYIVKKPLTKEGVARQIKFLSNLQKQISLNNVLNANSGSNEIKVAAAWFADVNSTFAMTAEPNITIMPVK